MFRKTKAERPRQKLANRAQPSEPVRQRQVNSAPRQSNTAFSYHASRRPEVARESDSRQTVTTSANRPKFRRPHFSFGQIPFWVVVIVVAICIGKLMFLSNSPHVIIVGQKAAASQYLQNSDVYAAAAAKALGSSPVNHLKLTADLSGVAKILTRDYPELQDVSVTVPLIGNRPIVYIMPAVPSVIVQTAAGNYALNASGIALARVTTLPATSAHVPLLHDETGNTPQLGKQFLPASNVSFVQNVAYQLQAAQMTPSSYTFPTSSLYELDVQLVGKGYSIKFNLQGDSLEQSGAAVATLQQLGAKPPATYLDVRVPGRVYYK